MSLNRTTWFAIADGGHARIIAKTGEIPTYQTQWEADSATIHRKAADLGTDRPGKGHETGSAAHHAIEPRSDRHDRDKANFEAVVAEKLNEAGNRGEFDILVLIAPDRVLPVLRSHLHPNVAARVGAELAKDLTKISGNDLAAHLDAIAPVLPIA